MFKCNFCKVCNGHGCKGQLPGMGGVFSSANFIANCLDWDAIFNEACDIGKRVIGEITVTQHDIGIAPVTGAVENIGFNNEADFYPLYIGGANKAGIAVCVGDGYPDEKLMLGIESAASCAGSTYFLKPYSEYKILERVDRLKCACAVGCDIDSYNIITMRNKVSLEKKTASQLRALRTYSKLPLAIKGVFTKEDIELCKETLSDIIVVSNHGGRVETDKGSSARFLQKYGRTLKKYCAELWVDGGIRKKRDIKVAKYLGADKVLIGRPFITAVCKSGIDGMGSLVEELTK